jgi:WD40 repeat protein
LNLSGFDWQALTPGTPFQACSRRNASLTSEGSQFEFWGDPSTGLMSSWQQAFGHGSRVFGLAFHPHSPNVIASASEDETVRVWGREASSGDWQQVRQQELCMIMLQITTGHHPSLLLTMHAAA